MVSASANSSATAPSGPGTRTEDFGAGTPGRPGRRPESAPGATATVHAGEVPVAEPLDRVAAAELADRRERHALAMAGKPYRSPGPLQLNPGR